ncbi:MAG: DUF4190 domain-containing protein [Bacteroidales bacterium]|nr:DUF4190 domain-containing protein [Bacteroidales bacterium]
MNFKYHFNAKGGLKLVFVLFFSLTLSNCTLEKRTYRSGYYLDVTARTSANDISNLNKKTFKRASKKINAQNIEIPTNLLSSKDTNWVTIENTASFPNTSPPDSSTNSVPDSISTSTQAEDPSNKIKPDLIILQTGNEIRGKVYEISDQLVKYKKIENIDGPMYSLAKGTVFMIQYSNGTREYIKPVGTNREQSTYDRKEDSNSPVNNKPAHKSGAMGAISFTLGILGLFIFGLLAGIGAIILAVLNIGQNRKLKGLAVVGLILGIFDVLAVVYILSTM